ncbi:uncharacterized protein N7484_000558 [Penicillium longicatenatum]|uniref:uncharacterized protein n=1 Tax=Penicillium longicatenatum TaxID=1561947 RepID=UPI002548F0BA|nr:uncharacterized protein N7484_000558 [Penicillium longicatenatum]KAJ5661186.1 hypothetical protein N7484_000558 [Penicillium longicatenatum]
MTIKVALITGGASGMGLAVARKLSAREDWVVNILDISENAGTKVAQELPRVTFHKANVTKYGELCDAFQKSFLDGGNRLDFVFANAGVIERTNFYAPQPTESVAPPPEPDLLPIDADLKGVVLTTWLAQHYFRLSPHKGRDANIVMTASCGGLYPSFYSPLYSAAKFGVVGFMRSIAANFRANGMRVNAICPGIVRTNLVDEKGWDSFPPNRFVKIETIAQTVLHLVDGGSPAGQGLTDTVGKSLAASKLYGLAVEISDTGLYFRDQHDFCDEGMREVMGATELDNQVDGVLNE